MFDLKFCLIKVFIFKLIVELIVFKFFNEKDVVWIKIFMMNIVFFGEIIGGM